MEHEELKKPTTPVQAHCLKIASILCFVVSFMVVIWANSPAEIKGLNGLFTENNIFAWHPVLMVLGMVVCYSQAILAYRAFPLGKPTNKLLHLIFQSLAIILVLAGIWAVVKFHNDKLIANLYSTHSWLGLATLILFFQNYILGFITFWLPFATPPQRRSYLPSHVYLGVITYFFAVLAVETGIAEKNAWLGCGYQITEPDLNPISHYWDIPYGCQISNWMAILILVLALTTGIAVMNLRIGQKPASTEAEALLKHML